MLSLSPWWKTGANWVISRCWTIHSKLHFEHFHQGVQKWRQQRRYFDVQMAMGALEMPCFTCAENLPREMRPPLQLQLYVMNARKHIPQRTHVLRCWCSKHDMYNPENEKTETILVSRLVRGWVARTHRRNASFCYTIETFDVNRNIASGNQKWHTDSNKYETVMSSVLFIDVRIGPIAYESGDRSKNNDLDWIIIDVSERYHFIVASSSFTEKNIRLVLKKELAVPGFQFVRSELYHLRNFCRLGVLRWAFTHYGEL